MKHNITILEGATGTELIRRGFQMELPLWSGDVALREPQLLLDIHKQYICAGADLITANTYRTTKRVWSKVGQPQMAEVATAKAIAVARDARNQCGNTSVKIGGVVGTLEDSYEPQAVPDIDSLNREHRQHIECIVAHGVDFIMIPTINTIDEGEIILRHAKATGLPCYISFAPGVKDCLLSGESVSSMVHRISALEPDCLMLNCYHKPVDMMPVAEALANSYKGKKGIFANGAGYPKGDAGWGFINDITPEIYLGYAKQWADMGYEIIGGCCGTDPSHIQALAEYFH